MADEKKQERRGPSLGAFPEGLPPDREKKRQTWLKDRREQFDRGISEVASPSVVAAFIDAILGAGSEQNTGPSVNELAAEMGGRDGPPISPRMHLPQDDFLADLLANDPINAGPPPGPIHEVGGPKGSGVSLPPELMSMLVDAGTEGADGDSLGSFADAGLSVIGNADQPKHHPRRTLSFLQELLGDYPLEMFNAPDAGQDITQKPLKSGSAVVDGEQIKDNDPRVDKFQNANRYRLLPTIIEIINQGLTGRGQEPIGWENDPGEGRSVNSFVDWARGFAQSEDHFNNILRKRSKENVEGRWVKPRDGSPGTERVPGIRHFPPAIQALIDPDANRTLLDNPGGGFPKWMADQLARTGNPTSSLGEPAQADPHDILKLRNDQMKLLLAAGPDRSSLIDERLLAPEEAALARQVGGLDNLATMHPNVLGRTGGEAPTPDVSIDRGRINQIGAANSDALSKLLSSLSESEGGPSPLPADPAAGMLPDRMSDPRSFIDQFLSAWGTQVGRDAPHGAAGQGYREMNSVYPTGDPTPQEVLDARFMGEEPEGSLYTDPLEGDYRGLDAGLDPAGNLRVGGLGGEVFGGDRLMEIVAQMMGMQGYGQGHPAGTPMKPQAESRPLDLGLPDPGRNPDPMGGMLPPVGGMRPPDMSMLPKNPGSGMTGDLGLPMPSGDQGMTTPPIPQTPGGMRPFPLPMPGPEGLGLPMTPDFIQVLLSGGFGMGMR